MKVSMQLCLELKKSFHLCILDTLIHIMCDFDKFSIVFSQKNEDNASKRKNVQDYSIEMEIKNYFLLSCILYIIMIAVQKIV